MEEDNRRRAKRTSTWTRSKRSCRFCSSRKQRCELPQTEYDFETIFTRCLDASTSLPAELRCMRCRSSKRECIPAVPGFGRQATRQTTHHPTEVVAAPTSLESTSASDRQDTTARVTPDRLSSIPNTSLSGLMRDIPSENVSSALFPNCSGSLPKELRLSPLAILPCLCKDVAPRQREFRDTLAKYDSPCCDHNAPLELLVEPDAMQLLFDCFPGLDRSFLPSIKEETPILHDTIKYALAFVCTGRHRYLKNCAEGVMFTMLACPGNVLASLVMVFLATYVPLEVAPVMPPAQDMNFLGFADTVNATGLLKVASTCAKRANFSRPSAAYLRVLNSELGRTFLSGEDVEEYEAKLVEMKRDLDTIRTSKETVISFAVLKCRVALLEISFEALKWIEETSTKRGSATYWDVPSLFPIGFTHGMRSKCRVAISAFCRDTNVDSEMNRHPVLSSLHALAARLELVLQFKAHYLSTEPLLKHYSNATWPFAGETLNNLYNTDPRFQMIWKARQETQETARRLLIHSNDAFDTKYPTIIATREMLTAIALATKQLLETHVGLLAIKRHNEDEMRSDGLLLRQTAVSVGRAETILAKALASTVDSMAKALRTWQNKLIKMNVPGPGPKSSTEQVPTSIPAALYDPVRQVTTDQAPQVVPSASPLSMEPVTSDQTLADMTADWDSVLTDLLGSDLDWNWIAF